MKKYTDKEERSIKRKARIKERKIRRTKPKYKIPTKFRYGLWYLLFLNGSKILGIKPNEEDIKEIGKIEGPVLAIGAHVSGIDFSGMMTLLKNKRFAFVVAANLFYDKFFAMLFRIMGNIIPKKQFSVDFECIKAMKFFVDNGTSIGIYPEGRVSIEGKPGYVSDATLKLIKYLNIPVVFTYTPGGYSQRPRYANKMRKGTSLQARGRILLNKEEVNEYSLDKIRQVVDEAFSYNEMLYQQEKQLYFVPKSKKVSLTYGLDFLLNQCPKCLKECAMVSNGSEMYCSNCNNTIEIDPYGKINPKSKSDMCFERIDLWYDFQKQSMQNKIDSSLDYERNTKVTLYLNDDENLGFSKVDEGILTLNKEGFSFNGQKFTNLNFSIKESPFVSVRLGETIDFFVNYTIYKFVFETVGEPAQYNLAVELLNKKYYSK